MNSCSFARIVSAQIAAQPEVTVAITLDLLSAKSGCTLRRCAFDFEELPNVMAAACVHDFDALKNSIIRVGVNEAGGIEAIAGPDDGNWTECNS